MVTTLGQTLEKVKEIISILARTKVKAQTQVATGSE